MTTANPLTTSEQQPAPATVREPSPGNTGPHDIFGGRTVTVRLWNFERLREVAYELPALAALLEGNVDDESPVQVFMARKAVDMGQGLTDVFGALEHDALRFAKQSPEGGQAAPDPIEATAAAVADACERREAAGKPSASPESVHDPKKVRRIALGLEDPLRRLDGLAEILGALAAADVNDLPKNGIEYFADAIYDLADELRGLWEALGPAALGPVEKRAVSA